MEVTWTYRHVQEHVAFDAVTGEEVDVEDVKRARQEERSWLSQQSKQQACRKKFSSEARTFNFKRQAFR